MKLVSRILIAILLTVLPASIALAQGSEALIFPPPNQLPNVFGQTQAYSVTLRGNGEAVVTTKVIFTNSSDNELSTFNLRVPRVVPDDIIAYQVIREPTCIRYKPLPVLPADRLTRPTRECEEFQEPDYFYDYGNSKYQKAQTNVRGDTIELGLPQPVKPNGSGSFLLYYRAFGYAKKNLFGAFNFTFETIKVEEPIRELTVGISTDSDLILRGAQGKVSYRFPESISALKSLDGAGAPAANAQFDRFYQQIGQGEITKKASDLQPLDSYTVKGSYADSRFKLYGKEGLIGLGVLLIGAALLALIVKAAILPLIRGDTKAAKEVKSSTTNSLVFAVLGLSFISSVLILLYSAGLMAAIFFLESQVSDVFGLMLGILLAVASLAFYGLLMLGPSLFVSLKKGVAWGAVNFGLTLVWLLIYLSILAAFYFVSFRRNYPYPMPYLMDRVFKSGQSAPSTGIALPEE